MYAGIFIGDYAKNMVFKKQDSVGFYNPVRYQDWSSTTKKEIKMVDVTIPRDARVNEREVEKIKVLKDEIARM